MNTEKKKYTPKAIIIGLLKWTLMAAATGAVCGVVGALFSHGVSLVTSFRGSHSYIIYLLPAAGLLSVLIYKLFRVTGATTDDAVESAHTDRHVSPRLTPAVFICSVITHLFGGSAGREGAALKMGGGIAALFAKAFKLSERDRRTLAIAGMSGVFAAVFGTPFGAALFTLEVIRGQGVRPFGIVVSAVSSFSAYGISLLMGVHPERYHIPELPALTLPTAGKLLLLAVLCGLVSFIFCHSMHGAAHLAKHFIKNDYIRIASLSALLVILTLLAGTYDYNGGGIAIIEGIFHGEAVRYEAFAMKILFTAVTVAAGYKGGEIVPAFFTGATFGGAFAAIFSIPAPFAAGLGMAALFAGVTNCPLATILLSIELFGLESLPFMIPAILISFLLSGEICLYDIKKYPFIKKKA